MTDVIYERYGAREAAIWSPFQFNGPFGTLHNEERTVLFGLYANTYLHGENYLREIETEELARLVDTYDNNMAKLANDEAQTVLEIAAKRHVEVITNRIHAADMVTREKKIDALDAEYSAKMNALNADYAALETMRKKVEFAWEKANQKVKDLEMRTELEGVNFQLVEVEITEQELRAARADLAVITAGLKGLDIQLAITQTGIDMTNTDLQITEAGNRVDEIGIQVSEIEVQESGVDLDITNAGIALSKSEAAGERIKVDTQGVAVRVANAELQTVETEAKEYQMDAEISRIEADTAKLGLVNSELTIAEANKQVALIENELLVQEKRLIDTQGVNVAKETGFIGTQEEKQEILDGKILNHDETEHKANIQMSQDETELADGLKDIKVESFKSRRGIADDIKETKVEDATERTALDRARSGQAFLYHRASVEAAQSIADADIQNTLTHSIGAA